MGREKEKEAKDGRQKEKRRWNKGRRPIREEREREAKMEEAHVMTERRWNWKRETELGREGERRRVGGG